jgi:hypothetical protein
MPDHYLGLLVNPKTKGPVHVIRPSGGGVRIYGMIDGEIKKIGDGNLETDEYSEYAAPAIATGYPRSHTPSGVQPRGMGYGTCLYTGLCLLAHYNHTKDLDLELEWDGDGISSDPNNRSHSAGRWWSAAERLELTSTEEGEGRVPFSDEDVTDYFSDYFSYDVPEGILGEDTEVEEIEVRDVRASGVRVGSAEYDVYAFDNADEHNLVILGQPQVIDLDEFIETGFVVLDDWDYVNGEGIIALNVTDQPRGFVQMLMKLALAESVAKNEVQAMYERFAVDTDPVWLGGKQEEMFAQNPNMEEEFEQLEAVRGALGWTELEGLDE